MDEQKETGLDMDEVAAMIGASRRQMIEAILHGGHFPPFYRIQGRHRRRGSTVLDWMQAEEERATKECETAMNKRLGIRGPRGPYRKKTREAAQEAAR